MPVGSAPLVFSCGSARAGLLLLNAWRMSEKHGNSTCVPRDGPHSQTSSACVHFPLLPQGALLGTAAARTSASGVQRIGVPPPMRTRRPTAPRLTPLTVLPMGLITDGVRGEVSVGRREESMSALCIWAEDNPRPVLCPFSCTLA